MSDTLLQDAQIALQAGKVAEAARLYHDLLRTDPRHFDALSGLGLIYFHTGRFEQAQYLIGEALKLDPLYLDGLCVRGVALANMKRYPDALACFERAMAMRPDFVEALTNHATTLLEMGRCEEALGGFDRTLAIDPFHAISWNNRGNALVKMKRYPEAADSYERALAIDPGLIQAAENRDNALFELKRSTRCPPGSIRRLFDDFASHYDETMLEKLGYRAHLHLRTLADRVLPRLTPPWRVLDLGSGTGLVGGAFKDLVGGGRLDGVDIAPRMIEAARRRGIYDDLILGDVEAGVFETGTLFELILAGDTLIYIGDLSTLFAGVSKRLEQGGFYLLAVESMDQGSWEQTPKNRFRHSESYLRAQAQRAGLDFVELMECTLRRERSEPVKGFAVA